MTCSPIRSLTLNVQEGDPPTLHPHKGVDLRSRCLFLALFEPLMRRQPDGSLEFAAAKKVEVDSSQTRYTFSIRPHLWSDGTPVTAAHFADAWRYALTPNSPCLKADLFYSIKNGEAVKKGILPLSTLGISTPDDETLVVELEHPTPYFLDLTATSFFAPLYHAHDAEPNFFNGPFLVGTWQKDKELVLDANPQYWDRAGVHLDQIHFTMVTDAMTALALFEQGSLDLIGDPFSGLPLDALPHLATTNQLKTRSISRIFYLLTNTSTPPLHNASFRRALSACIDRETLAKSLFFGETPASSHLPAPLSLLPHGNFSLEMAIAHLEKALSEMGLTRETLPKISLQYANLTGQKRLVEFLQETWRRDLGIHIDVQCLEWNTHAAQLRKKTYQMGTIHLTTLYQDPMFYFELFHDKSLPSNYSAWDYPPFQSLLKTIATTTIPEQRQALLRQAELMLQEEMPVIPLFTQNLQYLVRDGIDLRISDLGIYDFKQTRVKPK